MDEPRMTNHLSGNAAVLRILFASQVDEVELDAHDCRTRGLQMFGLVGITLYLRDTLYCQILHRTTIFHEAFGERDTHHVLERDIDIITL